MPRIYKAKAGDRYSLRVEPDDTEWMLPAVEFGLPGLLQVRVEDVQWDGTVLERVIQSAHTPRNFTVPGHGRTRNRYGDDCPFRTRTRPVFVMPAAKANGLIFERQLLVEAGHERVRMQNERNERLARAGRVVRP